MRKHGDCIEIATLVSHSERRRSQCLRKILTRPAPFAKGMRVSWKFSSKPCNATNAWWFIQNDIFNASPKGWRKFSGLNERKKTQYKYCIIITLRQFRKLCSGSYAKNAFRKSAERFSDIITNAYLYILLKDQRIKLSAVEIYGIFLDNKIYFQNTNATFREIWIFITAD